MISCCTSVCSRSACSPVMGNLVVDSMSLFIVQQNSLLHLVTFFACCIHYKKSIQQTDIEAMLRLQICALAWDCCMKKNIDILSLHWLLLLNPSPLYCRSLLFVNSCWPLLEHHIWLLTKELSILDVMSLSWKKSANTIIIIVVIFQLYPLLLCYVFLDFFILSLLMKQTEALISSLVVLFVHMCWNMGHEVIWWIPTVIFTTQCIVLKMQIYFNLFQYPNIFFLSKMYTYACYFARWSIHPLHAS